MFSKLLIANLNYWCFNKDMNKNISWKQSLLIALICYVINFTIGTYLPRGLSAAIGIAGLFTLIIGIIGGIKTAFTKKKSS